MDVGHAYESPQSHIRRRQPSAVVEYEGDLGCWGWKNEESPWNVLRKAQNPGGTGEPPNEITITQHESIVAENTKSN